MNGKGMKRKLFGQSFVLKNIFLSFLLTTFITIHNKSKIAEIFTQASKESEIPSPSIEGLNISRGTKPNVVI